MKKTKSIFDYKIKNRYIIYLVIIGYFLGSFLGIFSHNTIASISGDYYVQNFTGLNGEGNITCTDESITWLNIKSMRNTTSPYPVVTSDYYYITSNAGGSTLQTTAWFNFTRQTTNISFDMIPVISAGGGGASASYEYVIFDTLGNRMMKIRLSSVYSAGEFRNLSVFGDTDSVLLYGHLYGKNYANFSGKYIFNINTNNTIRFRFTNNIDGLFPVNVVYSPPTFDYTLTTRFMAIHSNALGSSTVKIDNVSFLKDVEDIWEINSDYTMGSVMQSYSNYTTSLSTTDKYFILEKKPSISIGGINTINQFALAVSTTCELTKMSILLHMDGIDYGYYADSYYVTSSLGVYARYVLVWTNLNHQTIDNMPKIEILISGTTLPCSFTYMVYNGDIDNDVQTQFKYSSGTIASVLPYFNGLYDGKSTSVISEPQYKIWYNSTSGTTGCGVNLTGYSYNGNFIYTQMFQGSNTILEIKYDVPVTMTLKGFQLMIGENQATHESQPSGYTMKINGEPIGQADCLNQYGDGLYLLTWNFTKLITTSTVLFEVYCAYPFQVGLYNGDIDGDGKKQVKSHNDLTLYDGIYNGATTNYDVAYKFYYSTLIIPGQDLPYLDYIGTSKTTWKVGDEIVFDWSATTSVPQNFIVVTHNGSAYELFGFPMTTTGQIGNFKFTPVTTGTYKFMLQRPTGSTKASYNITVSHSSNENYLLFTYPNPSDVGTFYIFCKYYNPTGDIGLITVGKSNLFDLTNCIFQTNINSNNSYNFSTSVVNADISEYYVTLYQLFEYQGNTSVSQLLQKIHNIRSAYLDNTLIAIPTTGTADKQHPLNVTLVVSQNTFSNSIIILKNGNPLFTVIGSKRDQRFYDSITTPGIYRYSLVIRTSNSTIYLANATVDVSQYEQGTGISLTIEPPFSYFAGIFIVLLFVLTPLLIGRLTNNMMHLPQMFYLIMAVVGFVVSCLFGFFPYWTILVLVILAVLIFSIMWLQRKVA
jgi:hypothetical protein